MKKSQGIFLIVLLIILVLLSGCGMIFPQGPKDEGLKSRRAQPVYRLGPNDGVRIEVFGESDLTTQTEVSGQGRIKFPLLGELDVDGKTVKEVEEEIISRLKEGYLHDPQVTVTIVKYRNFYIHGEVVRAGAFPYQEGLSALKAITAAGGFSDKAAAGRTKVLRTINGKDEMRLLEMDELIHPDDIIIVPESFF